MKFIKLIKSYKKPNPDNAFSFINLYHADIFDDDKMYNIDESLLDEIEGYGILDNDEVLLLKKNIKDDQIDGWFLNDNFEESKLKDLKDFLSLP